VEGQLPRLVGLGLLQGEAGRQRLLEGMRLMKEWIGQGPVTLLHDDDRCLSSSTIAAVKQEAEGWGWEVKVLFDYMGAEATSVVVVGHGHAEAVSRARLQLGILHCCEEEDGREFYNMYLPGYRAAVDESLVVVAVVPPQPQVRPGVAAGLTCPQPAGPAGDAFRDCSGQGRALLPQVMRHPQFADLEARVASFTVLPAPGRLSGCWPAGWLGGRLAGWVAGWPAGWLAAWLARQLAGWPPSPPGRRTRAGTRGSWLRLGSSTTRMMWMLIRFDTNNNIDT
jgi:hypothetical protein